MKTFIIFFITTTVFLSCRNQQRKYEFLKDEILLVEKAFNKRVANNGIREAFVFYADEKAVLLRNGKLIKGKSEIISFYENFNEMGVRLTWTPEYVDVSESGDLAYTYGKYQYHSIDSTGNMTVSEGVFHTIWKKQEDGSWKYVWD